MTRKEVVFKKQICLLPIIFASGSPAGTEIRVFHSGVKDRGKIGGNRFDYDLALSGI
jgi:hypothetical protein